MRLDPTLTRDREDCQFGIHNFDVYQRAAMRLNDNASWFDSVAFQFSADEQKIPSTPLQRVRATLPHLAKALDVGRSFRQLKLRYQAVLTALDHVHVGMLVLRYDGEPIVVNTAARQLLEQRDAAELDAHGRLRFLSDTTRCEFDEAVSRLALTASGRGKEESITLSTKLRSKSLPLLIEITPLRDSANELGDTIHGVSVLLIDPSMGAGIRTDRVAHWAQLTKA